MSPRTRVWTTVVATAALIAAGPAGSALAAAEGSGPEPDINIKIGGIDELLGSVLGALRHLLGIAL